MPVVPKSVNVCAKPASGEQIIAFSDRDTLAAPPPTMTTPKTNAARLLDQRTIAYRVLECAVGEEHLDAVQVAEQVGLPADSVFKTLVARGDRHGPCMAVIPGPATLDLKALARASGDRSVALIALKEVTPLTGYVRGGVTALAAKRELPVYLDETATLFDEIAVSAGKKGLQLLLAPDDYIRATSAKLARLTT